MDISPKTTFVMSPETETERIIYTCRMLARGFYQDKGFAVVSALSRPGNQGEVLLPRAKYTNIPGFWKKVREISDQFPIRGNEMFKQEIWKVIKESVEIDLSQLRLKDKDWQEKDKQYWNFLRQMFPRLYKLVGSLEVRLTQWGTVSSISILNDKPEQKVILYLRTDAESSNIAEILTTALLRTGLKNWQVSWRETELAVDCIFKLGRMNNLFPDYQATMSGLGMVKPELKQKSVRYLETLGLPKVTKDLSLNGRRVYWRGKPAEAFLTEREELFIAELLRHEGEILSFDEVMNMMWERQDQESVWALNKAIQRLRKKLTLHGLEGDRLQTIRKRGYLWRT